MEPSHQNVASFSALELEGGNSNGMDKPLALVLAVAAVGCLVASDSRQDEINSSYSVNSNTNTESIKIGNTKTNNYNIRESNYLPTQLTQVVVNVPKPKPKGKLRSSRPPTEEEYAIKRKIGDVYEQAKAEGSTDSLPFNHLGRIIKALNPKYIATERVRKAAFADSSNLAELGPLADMELPFSLKLSPVSGPVTNQLDSLNDKFRQQVTWNQFFIEELENTGDGQLSPVQLAFKSLILCLDRPLSCNRRPEELPTHNDNGAASDLHLQVGVAAAKSGQRQPELAADYVIDQYDDDDGAPLELLKVAARRQQHSPTKQASETVPPPGISEEHPPKPVRSPSMPSVLRQGLSLDKRRLNFFRNRLSGQAATL